jgi:WD40 repeat protein
MDRRDFRLIDTHNTPVAAIALALNGSRLATASEKGTLVRVFDTSSGHKLQELRRGTDPAEIYHISFDRSCAWLAVTSDKNTVHVFALRDVSEKDISGATAAARVVEADRRAGGGTGVPTSPTAGAEAKNKGSWLNIAQVSDCFDPAVLRNLM